MLDELLGANIWRVVREIKGITEVRMRISRPIAVCTSKGERIYPSNNGSQYVVSRADIDYVLGRATNMSLYSASDEIVKGYIPAKHFRIGVGGEGVMIGDKLCNVKNISYLVIRVPHQIKEVADDVCKDIFVDTVRSTLVISPTGSGKTTMLRELARIASKLHNVVVIDERYELCAVTKGTPLLDVGDVEVISGVPKTIAYENCIRAMNPDIIVTDELCTERDVYAVCDMLRSGIKVFASVHGESVAKLKKSKTFSLLLEQFDIAITLSKRPVGKIVEKVLL